MTARPHGLPDRERGRGADAVCGSGQSPGLVAGPPRLEVRFDADKAAAAASRRRILGMIAEERLPAIGYRMPFSGAWFRGPPRGRVPLARLKAAS